MTRSLVIKHLKIDSNGKYKYSRRVPKKLQSILGKKEFSKVLDRTEFEAMRNYGPYHDRIEQLLRTARPTSDASEILAVMNHPGFTGDPEVRAMPESW